MPDAKGVLDDQLEQRAEGSVEVAVKRHGYPHDHRRGGPGHQNQENRLAGEIYHQGVTGGDPLGEESHEQFAGHPADGEHTQRHRCCPDRDTLVGQVGDDLREYCGVCECAHHYRQGDGVKCLAPHGFLERPARQNDRGISSH